MYDERKEELDAQTLAWLVDCPEGEVRYHIVFWNKYGEIVRQENYSADTKEGSQEHITFHSSKHFRTENEP